jgi:hypothetical protein
MLSRALSLAAVTLLIGCFAAAPAWAQATNLEAGKSPSQIFAGTCNACHKSPRGLLRTVPAGSLSGFLRQHYTTSSEMASLLSAFLVSNGAADTRYIGAPPKGTKDAKSDARPPEQLDRYGRRMRPAAPAQEAARPEAEPQQAVRPDADGLSSPQAQGRNARRLARPGEAPDAAKPAPDGQVPAQAAIERGPDGRKLTAKQRLGKRAKPGGEEPLKMDEPAKVEPAKEDSPADKPAAETAKEEGGKPEPAKPAEATKPAEAKSEAKSEPKSEPAKVEVPKDAVGGGEPPVLRADPVPAVTPAPPAPPAVSAATTSASPEPAARPAPPAPPPTVTASVPPPEPPVAPAGPPAPPISQ